MALLDEVKRAISDLPVKPQIFILSDSCSALNYALGTLRNPASLGELVNIHEPIHKTNCDWKNMELAVL